MGQPDTGRVVVIGAGPAGLTAAFEMSKHGIGGAIVEADELVGGISRTVERDGFRFDLGGHRFFTKSSTVQGLWDEMTPEPMLVRPRMSRIFYGGKFYDYPLKASNALGNMGLFTALACMGSYALAKMRPLKNPDSFEEWVTNEFGHRLYTMFFKTYTEKVWGMPCSRIEADWAAQRIKGLSLGTAVKHALFGQGRGGAIKTLIDEFRYPRFGPGQLWEACAERVVGNGWELLRGTRVTELVTENGRVAAIRAVCADGSSVEIACRQVFSSMPLRELIKGADATAPEVRDAAKSLAYRDFLTVALVIDAESVFPDNWVYVHSPEVRLGRIQNFKNWSPDMVPDRSKTCLGLEYFCNEGDDLWEMPDDQLIELGYSELKRMNLAKGELVTGHVVRVPKAYPVYDRGYRERVELIRSWAASTEGLACIGRNGQHRYNNMDHSMMTAVIAVRNLVEGTHMDPWAVNEDAEYHEIAQQAG